MTATFEEFMPDPAERAHFELMMAIGSITFAWAHVELVFDVLNHAIHQRLDGARRVAPELPRALNKKISHLRRAANALDELAPFKAEIIRLCDNVSSAADHRHDVVHGALAGAIPDGLSDAVEMTRLVWGPTAFTRRDFKLTAESLLKSYKISQDLERRANALGLEIWTMVLVHKSQQPSVERDSQLVAPLPLRQHAADRLTALVAKVVSLFRRS